jgi:hypothetical protein
VLRFVQPDKRSLAALLRTCKYLVPEVQAETVTLVIQRWYPSLPEQLPHLEDLTICDSFCQALPETIGELAALQTLHLPCCLQLQSLPETIGELAALQTLDLLDLQGCSQLQLLPGTIGELAALQQLNLQDCSQLQSLPETIGELAALQRLYLCM